MRGLFHLIMEADGDPLEAFDPGESMDAPPEEEAPPQEAPSEPQQGDDTPPPPNDEGMDELAGFEDTDEGDQMGSEDASNDDQTENQEDQKLSEKANSVLNQALYQKLVKRNQQIEETIQNIQQIIPVLPQDIIQSNDVYMTRLKAALEKGQQYSLEKFVDSGYGENALFYEKLDALYTILLNNINHNLKKFEV